MPFDPSQPYEVLDQPKARAFDPSQPYEALSSEEEQQAIPKAFIDRLRQGKELQDKIKERVGGREKDIPGIDSPGYEGALMAAQSLLNNFIVKPLVAHKELQESAARGELFDDPENFGKALDAASLGMFRTTQFSRITEQGLQRIGTPPTSQDFTDAASVLTQPSPKETVGQAAVKINGQVFRGTNHAIALDNARDALDLPEDEFSKALNKSEDGFVTSTGRFVDREEANKLAEASSQIDKTNPFYTAGSLTSESIKENLRDLWEQRGIHPAEAAHDAQNDAFLKQEIQRPNPDPTDRSGIITPRGSPMPEGTPRTALAKTGDPLIDRVLEQPEMRKVIDNPVVDDTHTIPNSLGGSVPVDNPVLYRDRRFPKTMTVDGQTFDTADPAAVHENVEEFVIDALMKKGMDQATALKVAFWEFGEKAEDAFYRSHGMDPEHVEDQYTDILDAIASSKANDVPPDLFRGTYPDSDPAKAGPGPIDKPTVAEVKQGRALLEEYLDEREGEPKQLGADKPPGTYTPKGYSTDVSRIKIGKEDGFLEFDVNPTELEMRYSYLPEEERGKGIGYAGYKKLVDWALSTGREFVSMTDKSPDAARIYDKLEKAGYKIESAGRPGSIKITEGPEGAPTALGAAATGPQPSLNQQPPPPVGSIVSKGKEAVGKLLGLGNNIQEMLDPMATGSNRAMVIAKDAVNSVRRIDWEWNRLDTEINKRFTPEQQKRMWDAGDEESVGRQLGEDMTHQGWATLEPEERLFVEYMDARAQRAWLDAVDAGIVEGDGLPAYMPRMLLNVASAEGKSPRALNELGRNVFTRTAQMFGREYMTAEETEAAMRARFGEEAGIARNIRALPMATARLEKAAVWKNMINQIEQIGKSIGSDTVANFKPGEGWFTVAGHPAFTKWKPDLEQNPITKAWTARTDDAGNTIFRPTPLWVAPEFAGPLKAILEQPTNKVYSAIMSLKGKAMTAILNSPLIHNEVVWGKVMEAAGGREWLGFGLYFRGNRIVNNPPRATELIQRGLNPIGPRGSFQDITSMLEQPNMQPGRSWTSQLLGFIPGLFDPAAETAVKRAVDKAGDFYHNTLLWDRVRDVQFGLADHLSDRLVNQGVNRVAADRIASHTANIIVGSIPKEAMSAGAQATANMLLFSRSFTLGNLSTFKQAIFGLPAPIKAQIMRDFGLDEPTLIAPTPEAEAAFAAADKISRRLAMSAIVMSAGLMYIGNALFQHAFNIARGDSSLENEINGYAERYHDLMKEVADKPSVLFNLVGRLSPTWNNEPTKSDRVHIGYDQDGTAIYGRLPFGKFGEEMIGYPTMPFEMLKRKLAPLVSGAWEAIENDKGFGRKIYDETDKSPLGMAKNAFAVAKHMVARELPEQQITAASDLLRGEGDKLVNELRVFGPMAGFTASVGAPGGMAKGEQLAAKGQFETRFNLAWPDIKKQIKNGDIAAAQQAMMDLGIPMRMQRGLMRSAMMPGNLSGRTLQDFFQYATPEQQQRFLNAR